MRVWPSHIPWRRSWCESILLWLACFSYLSEMWVYLNSIFSPNQTPSQSRVCSKTGSWFNICNAIINKQYDQIIMIYSDYICSQPNSRITYNSRWKSRRVFQRKDLGSEEVQSNRCQMNSTTVIIETTLQHIPLWLSILSLRWAPSCSRNRVGLRWRGLPGSVCKGGCERDPGKYTREL